MMTRITFYGKTIGLILFLCCLNAKTSFGLNITWLGSNGIWNVPANWDVGVVPTAADNVYIPSGAVYIPFGFAGVATHIEISPGATLQLRRNSTLTVGGSVDISGIINEGNLIVHGQLIVRNVTGITFPPEFGNGIYNLDTLLIGNRGKINIKNAINNGLYQEGLSYLTNNGEINIIDCGINGINSHGNFINNGKIKIAQSTYNTNHAMLNFLNFTNNEGATIDLLGGDEGLANAISTAYFHNYGDIHSYDAGHSAIRNSGQFFNYETGLIKTENSGYFNLYNRSTGLFTNFGECQFLGGWVHGIGNEGDIDNQNFINISNTQNAGIYAYASSRLDNHGDINFTDDQYYDIDNFGVIHNHDDGRISLRNALMIAASGTITNEGFLLGYADENYTLDAGATFTNLGVVADNHERMVPVIDNQGVIISPINDPLQNGVAYTPALNLVDDSNVDFRGWNTDVYNFISAGDFDANTNTFTPNIEAIGLSSIYILITIPSSGLTAYCEVPLNTPVAALTGKYPNESIQFRNNDSAINSNATEQRFRIFPNPTSGPLILQPIESKPEKNTIRITNYLGQLVFEASFVDSDTFQLHLPKNLDSGIYFVNIFNQNALIETKKIVLNNQ